MKRLLYVIIDLAIIFGSILLSFYLMEMNDLLRDFQQNFEAFVEVAPYIALLYIFLMYVFNLYKLTYRGVTDIIYTLFTISFFLMLGIMGICFFVRDVAFAFPRSVILLSALLYFTCLSLWQSSFWYISQKVKGKKKIIIVTNEFNRLEDVLRTKYARFYDIRGVYTEDDPALPAKIKEVDEVFISNDIKQRKNKILPLSIANKKPVCFIPKYFDMNIMAASYTKIDDIPVFQIGVLGLSPEDAFMKRIMDVIGASLLLIILSPIALIVALLNLCNGGNVFYLQQRMTQDRKVFTIYKFRTMIPNAERLSGPVLAGDKDPRITALGRFLRATRLDEIPQLVNIIAGDMSLVGPRPERPYFVEQFEEEIPEYAYRFSVKAGLTGLAQVEGKYNTTVEDKLRYDLFYINNYSLIKDIIILLQTVKILFMKDSTEGV